MLGDNEAPFLERTSVRGIRARIWIGRRLRSFLRPGSIIVALIGTAYAVCEVLREEDIPNDHAWTAAHFLGWMLAFLAGFALFGTLLVLVGYDRAVRKADQNEDLDEACRGLWHLTIERLGVDMPKVGVHVWSVKGIKGFRYLGRRSTFVIRSRRATNVLWRKGKGAIGIAWAEDETIIANVTRLDAVTTEEAFNALPADERFGLTWREFRRSRHYRSILAVPLRAHGRVVGCLSVDIQGIGYEDALDTLSHDEQFNNVLAVCEAVLAGRK